MKHSRNKLFTSIAKVSLLFASTTTFAATPYNSHLDLMGHIVKSHIEVGKASWYGPGFHGRPCADGSRFDQNKLTAAHRFLPLGTEAKVINLSNGKIVRVRITDRGPFSGDRVLDLSKAAAEQLEMTQDGVSLVQIVTKVKSINGLASKD